MRITSGRSQSEEVRHIEGRVDLDTFGDVVRARMVIRVDAAPQDDEHRQDGGDQDQALRPHPCAPSLGESPVGFEPLQARYRAHHLGTSGVLALMGKGKVQQATPPVPEQTVDSVKEDVQWTKERAKAARQ